MGKGKRWGIAPLEPDQAYGLSLVQEYAAKNMENKMAEFLQCHETCSESCYDSEVVAKMGLSLP